MHSHTLNLESFLTLKLYPTSIIPLQHKNEPCYYKCFHTSVVLSTLQEHTSIVDKVVQLWNVDKNWDNANGGERQVAWGGKWSEIYEERGEKKPYR